MYDSLGAIHIRTIQKWKVIIVWTPKISINSYRTRSNKACSHETKKATEPIEQKATEPIEQKATEPIAQKATEPSAKKAYKPIT